MPDFEFQLSYPDRTDRAVLEARYGKRSKVCTIGLRGTERYIDVFDYEMDELVRAWAAYRKLVEGEEDGNV